MARRLSRYGFVAVALFDGLIAASGASAQGRVTTVQMLARVTGATRSGELRPQAIDPASTQPLSFSTTVLPNPNLTHVNGQVHATDLGILWDNGAGQLLAAFGDTYGDPSYTPPPNGGAGGPGWRNNVLARSSDTSPADGLNLQMLLQPGTDRAKELIAGQRDSGTPVQGQFFESTIIPTAGVAVGSRQYMHYMSVRTFWPWQTNYAGIAWSDDNGTTWRRDPYNTWINIWWSPGVGQESKFQQAAFIKQSGYVYMFGTPNARSGPVHLARVPEPRMLEMNAFEYWDGCSWVANRPDVAAPLFDGQAGELSVVWNSHYGRFIMAYLIDNDANREIVLRTSSSLIGAWSAPVRLVNGNQHYPGLYAPFMHPWFNAGTDLYFTMSQWYPYNVFWMKASLALTARAANLAGNGDFESATNGPWTFEGSAGVDRGLGYAYAGSNNGWARSTSGWHGLSQAVAVQSNTNYRLTAFIRTSSNNSAGFFGVRSANNTVLSERRFCSLPGYTQLSVAFNSGTNTSVRPFAGMWALSGDTWLQLDNVTLTRD